MAHSATKPTARSARTARSTAGSVGSPARQGTSCARSAAMPAPDAFGSTPTTRRPSAASARASRVPLAPRPDTTVCPRKVRSRIRWNWSRKTTEAACTRVPVAISGAAKRSDLEPPVVTTSAVLQQRELKRVVKAVQEVLAGVLCLRLLHEPAVAEHEQDHPCHRQEVPAAAGVGEEPHGRRLSAATAVRARNRRAPAVRASPGSACGCSRARGRGAAPRAPAAGSAWLPRHARCRTSSPPPPGARASARGRARTDSPPRRA